MVGHRPLEASIGVRVPDWQFCADIFDRDSLTGRYAQSHNRKIYLPSLSDIEWYNVAMSKKLFISVVLCSLVVFYFSGVGFGFNFFGQITTAIAAFALLYLAGKAGWQRFYLVALSSFSSALALGCAFLSPSEVSGPLVTSFRLSPFLILFISALVGILALLWARHDKSKDRFATILLSVFVFNWVILAFNVRFYDDWKMENWLTVPFVIIIYITHRWFRLSNISYGLIFAYMMLHIYGSHYTYAEVPFGFWMQDVFDIARNHYDRIVHFSFGFLLAYPLREMTIRISDAKGFWGLWFPVEFVLAFSAIYELLEWLVAVLFGGDLGIAYLGTQGDVWDVQKDMFLAGLGALMAMLVVFVTVWYYRPALFWREFKDSLQVKHKKVLGEEALKELKK